MVSVASALGERGHRGRVGDGSPVGVGAVFSQLRQQVGSARQRFLGTFMTSKL